ncbi:yebI [Wigglesworthia glossinidia endosymbiont of Glossina brevipalpis]|uniref:High-affinity zinc uptake system membrane protein ZnuB n=1 Tax=Wigglesworthia glossinidia brevipalpis TaxID=36870 RepID=Q8D386_WIGBR|nr:yebI [Wigglesworthia glossinidia endosymbiont of Glossina brevipalpis]
MIEIFIFGWIAGILLSLAIGPLGSFLIWRKMSYFGDTLSHSSLLGISIGFVFKIDPVYSVMITMFFITLIITYIERVYQFSIDIILNIISNTALSLGLVISSLIEEFRTDLVHYLFGDLLKVNLNDIIMISIIISIIILIILWNWNSLLLVSINSELSYIDGINIFKIKLILMIIISLTIGLTMKFIGALTTVALFIIPAATARPYSKSPEKMSIYATLFSISSITFGLFFSVIYNIPSGPSVILCSTIFFFISLFTKNKDFYFK